VTSPVVESLDDARSVVGGLLGDEAALVRATFTGRQRNTTVPFRRVELRYVDLKSGRRLQVTTYDSTQAFTRNVDPGDAADEIRELLSAGYANWHVETTRETVQLRVSKKGRPLLSRTARRSEAAPNHDHDRAKSRRLDSADPVFDVLGIATSDGRVKPSRMAKFRQVQDFLAALDPVLPDLVSVIGPENLSHARPLRVVDLGCGNAYLTFAALRYLKAVKRLPVHVVGVDVKDQARAHNAAAATRLDVADDLQFIDSTIAGATVEHPPDLVVALHACDTATDDALARAVGWGAPAILAAPCCHHDIQRQLASAPGPAPYGLVTRHAILRERFADVLTDALRAAVLRIVGYRVDVIEFVDSVHTPRNALIRAVRTGARPSDSTLAAYSGLLEEWAVQPALATLLADMHPALAPSPQPDASSQAAHSRPVRSEPGADATDDGG
jgi:SAM-dependent methyltransferase